MERITQKDLEVLTERINKATGSPLEPYRRRGKYGKRKAGFTANIGNHHLSYAYGGVELQRTTSEGGGVTVTSHNGYGTKRELYNFMIAYLDGLSDSKN